MLSAESAYVEIVGYGTDGETLEVLTVTSENPKAAICYNADGQMLASSYGSCGNSGVLQGMCSDLFCRTWMQASPYHQS